MSEDHPVCIDQYINDPIDIKIENPIEFNNHDDSMLWEETKPEVFSSHSTDFKVEFNENIDLLIEIIQKDHNYCKTLVKIERNELSDSDLIFDEEETCFEEIKDEIDNYDNGDNSNQTTSSKIDEPILTKNRSSEKTITDLHANLSTISEAQENILNNTVESLNEPNSTNKPKTSDEFNDNMKNHCMDKHYECYHCSARFLRKKSLKLHLEAHAGIQHQCNICEALFTQKGNLKVHMLSHAGKKRFSCIDCKMKFSRKEGLMEHVSKNKENSPFSCTHCDEIFTMKCMLMKHITTHKKTHRCMQCQQKFQGKNLLKKHMAIHAQQKNFKCKTCNASFFHKPSLSIHIKSHHIKNNNTIINKMTKTTGKRLEIKGMFNCTKCNKMFTLKSSLVLHMMKHSRDDFIRCKLCKNKHQPIMDNLENTQRSSNDEESELVCEDCDTTFSRSECHEAHNAKNAGESKRTCKQCAAVFTKKCALAVHSRLHRKRRV